MIIYIDLLFLREILMNFFLIFCTNKILSNSKKKMAIITSSVIGASYTLICLIYPHKLMIGVRIIVMLSMVYIGTEHNNISSYLKNTLTYYLLSFLSSGISYYFYNSQVKRLIILIAIMIAVIQLIRSYKNKYIISNYICNVELNICTKRKNIKALIDTGHSLKSTDENEVIVLSPRIIENTQNRYLIDILLNNILVEENPYIKKVKIINYSSLGNKYGIKYGLPLKNVKIKYQGKEIYTDAVIIANDKNFNEYEAILSLSIIKGGKYNGNSYDYERKGKETIC